MPMFHCHLHLFCNTLNLKLKLRWIFTSFQNASNSADLLILWQALTWSSFCPWQINTKRIDWVLSGVCGGKNKRKKNAKSPSKSFSVSVCQMMMKRAYSAASWCSAFYFIQFVEVFIGEKKDLCKLSSPVGSRNYINSMLWKHLRILDPHPERLASDKSALLRSV